MPIGSSWSAAKKAQWRQKALEVYAINIVNAELALCLVYAVHANCCVMVLDVVYCNAAFIMGTTTTCNMPSHMTNSSL